MKKLFTLIAAALLTLCATAQTTLISYNGEETLPAGIKLGGTTVQGTVKLHGNKDGVNCLTLKNGYTTDGEYNGNAIILTTEGGFKAGDTISIAGAICNKDATKYGAVKVLNYALDSLAETSRFINSYTVTEDPIAEKFVLSKDADSLLLGRDGNTGTSVTYISVVRPAAATVVWTTTALVNLPGSWAEVQRTLNFMSDSTFVVKELYGEGTSDLILAVDKYGRVDFANSTMDSYYYTYQKVTGSNEVTNLCAYGAYYYSYTLNNNGDYYKFPDKLGGEMIMTYVTAFNGDDYVGEYNKKMYVCWGKTRLAGTKDHSGIASLVYTPAEGTAATDGNWVKDSTATIGFYYDELVGDTAYRVNNFYGTDKYFHFKVDSNGYLTSINQYLYTGNENITSLYPYTGNYSYTWGDNNYYIKDLTAVHNGEIGFFAYAYDANGNLATGATNWQKNYYVFDWENTDVPEPTVKGDVNGDNKVDISDVNVIISIICGTATATGKEDVNGDNKVDISDVNAVIEIICAS